LASGALILPEAVKAASIWEEVGLDLLNVRLWVQALKIF
jgi:hypothetical protein